MKLRLSDKAIKRLAQSIMVRVFRGVGPRGAEGLRPSETGVGGPGVYFYDHPYDAMSYASPGGGILYGWVLENKIIKRINNVIIVENPEDVSIEGLIPTEYTLDAKQIDEYMGEDFYRRPTWDEIA